MPSPIRRLLFLPLLVLAACPGNGAGPDAGAPDADEGTDGGADAGVPSLRCVVPLDRFLVPGTGKTQAKRIEGAADLVGGPNAWAKVGDYLLANDKIKVALQARDRHIGPNPYGGSIVDADLVRDGPGQDQFGEVALFYNLARTLDPELEEVLAPGGDGQPAIVAMSGKDVAQSYLRIKNIFNVATLDLDRAMPFKITNYFILNPGEQRVRYVTAFCNTGAEEIVTVAGDLADPGWSVELFNGQSCTGGFGYGGTCQGIDRMSWFGYQGDGVAYGYAPYKAESPHLPESTNAVMTLAGVTGILIGANGLSGLAAWLNPDATKRPGELSVPAGQARAVARDFVVGRDLGEVATLIAGWRGALTQTPTGAVAGAVTREGRPLPGARVAFQRDGEVATTFVTDAQGRYAGRLPTGAYLVSAWAPGSRASATVIVQALGEAPATADFALSAARRLTVTVRDAATGAPSPGKVTVLCATNFCPAPWSTLARFTNVERDPLPDHVQLIDFVPLSGTLTLELPEAEYRVLVSRGPEWTFHPANFPADPGVYVDLRTADGSVDATLAHVVDTAGWAAGDFHVHGVNSPDSYVTAPARILSFLSEGMDLLVATDHDCVSDYVPQILTLGAQDHLATVSGEEVSPVDFGHINVYPLTPDEQEPIARGAIDWAGGRAPTMTPAEIFAEARKRGATTVQLNHPRGWPLGVLTDVKIDIDTMATHADPKTFNMATPAGSSAQDTKLISADFNAYEVFNFSEDNFDPYFARPSINDWFTMLSRGMKVAAVGGSDSHTRFMEPAGYWRTWIKVPDDSPAKIQPAQVSAAVNASRATVGNGLYLQVSAVRVAKDGTPTSDPAAIGEVLAASADDVRVTVDVQAAPYLDVSKVEIYLHNPADDARCPVDPASPEFKTTRVACNGESNSNWPEASIAGTQAITLTDADKETAFQAGGATWWRWHKKVTFTLPAPATDNWIVAMAYGSRSLFPLVYVGDGSKPVKPFAMTNAVFVDADGNGYDKPPFKPPVRNGLPPPPPPPEASRPPSPESITPELILERWGRGAARRER